MFNKQVYKRIKETNQLSKLDQPYCELESDDLYMGAVYEAASVVLPKDFAIIDLGCYMAAQAFLFEDFRSYTGIDFYDSREYENYIPPARFMTKNSWHYSMSIQDFCLTGMHDPMPKKCYIIMNAVPEDGRIRDTVLRRFKNVAVCYPGREDIFQGAYAEGMKQLTDIINDAKCPYTNAYLKENPEIKKDYERRQKNAQTIINAMAKAPA